MMGVICQIGSKTGPDECRCCLKLPYYCNKIKLKQKTSIRYQSLVIPNNVSSIKLPIWIYMSLIALQNMQSDLYSINLFCFYSQYPVTLDLKALLTLIVKKDDDKFLLGARGVDVQFCVFCSAIRVRTR